VRGVRHFADTVLEHGWIRTETSRRRYSSMAARGTLKPATWRWQEHTWVLSNFASSSRCCEYSMV